MSLTLADALRVTNSALISSDGTVPQNAQDFENLMLAFLATEQFGSFPVTAWQDGSIPKALLQCDADNLSDLCSTLYNAISAIDINALIAQGIEPNPYLDLWGQSQYQESRNPSVQEVWTVWLSNSTGSDINLDASELEVAAGVNQLYTPVSATTNPDGTVTYSPVAITIPAHATNQSALVQATSASPGAAGHTGPGTILTVAQPNVPGLTVTNLNPDGSGSGLVVTGVNDETNAAYYARLQAKWPALSLLRGNTHDAWIYWIDAFGLTFNRPPLVLDADDPRNAYGGGHVVIVLDTGGADLTAIMQWLIDHKPINMPRANVHVFESVATNVTVTGTIYVPGASLPSVNNVTSTAINTALQAYATNLPDSGLIEYSAVVTAVRSVANVKKLEGLRINGNAADVSIDYLHFAQFLDVGVTLTWVSSD
jgi:hypothetical protein